MKTESRRVALWLCVVGCLLMVSVRGVAQEQQSVETLVKQIKDDDPKVRARAARALSEKADLKALPALLDALQDVYTHPWAAHGIYKYQTKEAMPFFIEGLRHDAPEVRWRSISILARIGDVSAAPKLMALLKDENPKVRLWAAWAMGSLKYKEAAQALVQATADPDPEVRASALAALKDVDAPNAVETLIKAMGSEEAKDRMAAAYALGGYPAEASVNALKGALKDKSPSVRQRAIISLIRIGPKATGAIRELAGSDDAALRLDLAIALAQLLGPVAMDDSAAPALEIVAAEGKGDAQTRAQLLLWRLKRQAPQPIPTKKGPPKPAEIDKLVTDAASEDMERAMAATMQLTKAGADAVPRILAYLEGG